MPEKIILEDGSEREVPTAEELTALQTQAEEAKKVAELQEQLEATKKELESSVPEGIKNLRENFKKLKATLNAKGIEVDESGNAVEKPQTLSKEEIVNTAKEITTKTLLENKVGEMLSKYDKDTREVIKKYYDKISTGESVTLENINEFFSAATSAAGVNSASQHPASQFQTVSGGEPRPQTDTQADLSKATELAKSLGYQFKNDPNSLINPKT